MKMRTAFVYLAVFLALAGYFYYFEVVRQETRIEKEEASRRLFTIKKDQVTAIRLEKRDGSAISLEKREHWRVVEPVLTPADEFSVTSLLTTIESLKVERQLETAATDLTVYGLDKPMLHLSFLAEPTWHHLRLGHKAPVSGQFYGSADPENRIVLLASTTEQSLNKSLFDLRSKELFTLKDDDIHRIEIEWPDKRLNLLRKEKEQWQASASPQTKIKSTKVEGFLNRLIWLRPKQFLDNGEDNLAQYGLVPPQIRVTLSSGDKTQTLLFGDTITGEGTYAKSEQLTGLVLVDEELPEELPNGLEDLEDRTLFSFKSNQVTAVALELEGETARLDRRNDKWEWTNPRPRKDPEDWRVHSLLWKLQEMEYEPGTPPEQQPLPEVISLSLVLFAKEGKKIGTILLPRAPSESTDPAVFWFSQGETKPLPYRATSKSSQGLYESVKNLVNPDS
jgi:hypothetical protein